MLTIPTVTIHRIERFTFSAVTNRATGASPRKRSGHFRYSSAALVIRRALGLVLGSLVLSAIRRALWHLRMQTDRARTSPRRGGAFLLVPCRDCRSDSRSPRNK